jgi:hypothetical protein
MRWHRQVLHVARKDLRLARWVMAAYLLLVLLAVVVALDFWIPADGVWWHLLVTLCGVVAVGVLVQGDSPSRKDAFWLRHPLSPSAVFGAKVAVVLVVLVGAGLLGELVALLAHDPPPGDALPLLGMAALGTGVFFGFGALAGALTRDLKTLLLVHLGAVIATMVWSALLLGLLGGTRLQGWLGPVSWLVPLVTVAALFALTLHQYHTRRTRRTVVLALALFVLSIRPTPLSFLSHEMDWGLEDDAPSTLLPPKLVAEARGVRDHQYFVDIGLPDGSPHHNYALTSFRARLRLPDGSTVEKPAHLDVVWLGSPILDMGEGEWLGIERWSPGASTQVSFSLSPREMEAVSRGLVRVSLHGRMVVRAPRLVMELPLRAGASAVAEGRRLRILEFNEEEGLRLVVRLSRIPRPQKSSGALRPWDGEVFSRGFDFVAVDEGGGMAVPFRRRSSRGTGAGLVLPGSGGARSTITLGPEPERRRPGEPAPLDRPFHPATLLLFDWRTVAAFPVDLVLPEDQPEGVGPAGPPSDTRPGE